MLYGGISNFEELSAIARMRLEHAPTDRKAPLWLADALVRLNKRSEAEESLAKFIGAIEALPDAHAEYVRACAKMSETLMADAAGAAPTKVLECKTKALEWLNRAVDHAPESVEALLFRARFYRMTPEIPEVAEKDRLGLARKDLDAADHQGTQTPQTCLFLAAEWLAHGDYDRTAAELESCEKFTPEAVQSRFSDLNDWAVAKLLLKAELAMRKGATTEVVALMDQSLASLTEKRHRVQVLEPAIVAYATAGKVAQARQCLDEYAGILRAPSGTPESARKLAGLQALVAGAENRPYAVIDALTPAMATDTANPEVWRMLAEAYGRTDQAGRAVQALNQYCRLNPRDPQAMLELAKQCSRMGEWKNALDAATAAESLDPANVVAKTLRIGAAINMAAGQRGGPDLAELKRLAAELVDLHKAQPDQVDVRILQAILANYLESPQEVERQLKLAIAECQTPLRAEMQLAGHYVRTKQIKEAVALCEAACQRHPNLAEPWLSLADIHMAGADYDSARDCFKRGLTAVTDKGERRSLSLKLAFLEVIHGDRTAGIGLLKEMAAQDPQEVQARLLLLGIRGVRDDPATAEKLIGELKQVEGENGLWWRLHQASLWLSLEDWRAKQKDIENLLRACVDANPGWSAPVLLQADLYERLNEVKRAEDALGRTLVANPSATEVASRLLSLLEKQGRFSDAEKVLQQIRVNPRVLSAWQIRIALGTRDYSRAIDELKLRVSNDNQDTSSRIQLASLVYQQTKDVDQAFKYLKEAEAVASDSQALIAVKASILKAEGRTAEALQVLDGYATSHNDFSAYWMRAVYLAEQGDFDRAEKDYRKLTTFAQNGEAGYELLGNFYAGTKKLDQGIAAIEEGLGAHPESLRLKRDLMRLLFQRGQAQDREKATEILGALEKQTPQDAELLTIRAAQILEQATPQSLALAREKLENAVKLEPRAVNAHYTLIGIAMRQGEYKAACDYAVRALESNPKNLILLLARGRAELTLGYAPMAVRLAREALQLDPNSTEALSLLAEGALGSREGARASERGDAAGTSSPTPGAGAGGLDRSLLQEVLKPIESSLARDPKNEKLLLSRAHLLAALEQPKAALPALEAYCQTEPGNRSIAVLLTMADLYRLTGDADKCQQKIEQARQIDPSSQVVTHARLLWLVSQNRWEELQGISAAYLSAKEQDPALLLQAASLLTGASSSPLKKEGLKLFERVAALAPTSAAARLGWASALYQAGDADNSEKVYREWLAQYPNDGRALNDLAWILQEHDQRYDAALELANKGLKLAPDNPNLLDTRGTILTHLPNRLADAQSDFTKLVDLLPAKTPEKAKALLRLGRLYVQSSDLDRAKPYLQTARDIDREINVFTAVERAEISQIVQEGGK
jgi:tetratricopeptide (TPR) repeat protein